MTSTSTIPLWGRAWKLTVKLASGEEEVLTQSSWDPEALRMVFDVLQSTLPSPYWYALIKIYNLNDVEMQNLLFNAVWLTLEAGYQAGPSKSSVIWDGPVLQVLFDRENVVDLSITFNCVAGPAVLEEQFINLALGPYSNQLQAVSKMIAQTSGNVDQQVSSKAQQMMQQKQYPRGKTIFGRTTKYFGQIADDNFLSHWIEGFQHSISDLFDPAVKTDPDIIYGPPFPPNYLPGARSGNITRSIIGVPRQSTFGILFTVLLDPRLIVKVPPLLVQLDQTVVRQQKIQIGQLPAILDQSGFVIAAQVHHSGDTRGNDWYTEVTGYTRGYCQNLLNGVFTSGSSGTATP